MCSCFDILGGSDEIVEISVLATADYASHESDGYRAAAGGCR